MKEFFDKLNALGKLQRRDIIEKDFHLHRILCQISHDEYLKDNLVFKGGTCLIKTYLDYYRFSEDLDFTWGRDALWKDKGKSEVARLCSAEITKVIEHFKNISDKLGLEFSGVKGNAEEVHVSSGGRMVLLFIGYHSDILNIPSRIKIEVNFVDKTLYPFQERELQSYVKGIDSEELEFLYEDLWNEYSKKVSFRCYDPREIFIEKCRASMTRKAYKLRDVIDIHFMEKEFGYSISGYKAEIKEKVRFALDLYGRYRENIELIEYPDAETLDSEEVKLLLSRGPEDLSMNIERIHKELEAIRKEIIEGIG